MKRILALLVLLGLASAPLWAEDKGIIQLQQQVTLLMSQVQDLQKGFETDMAAMKSLVGENTDTVNKLAITVGAIQATMNGQATISGQRQDQLAQQFQSLTDSISQLQARLNDMQQMLKQVQTAQQSLAAPPAPAPSAVIPAPAGGTPGTTGTPTMPAAGGAVAAVPGAPAAGGSVLPPQQLYTNALSDYVSGAYPLSQSEFEQFLQAYPTDPNAVSAMFYLGDIYYRANNYDKAIDEFNTLIEQYPDSEHAPGAELKKAFALQAKGDKAGCIAELRNLIAKYPQSQEARQAKEQLTMMGASPADGR